MKIKSVRIENFRSFKDEIIDFDNYNCFVGANGVGKSTILYALNVFFRQSKDSQTNVFKLSKDDFHHKNTEKSVRITVTFSDLSDQAKDDLNDYVRQNKLIVTAEAEYDKESEISVVKQYGNRLGFDEFKRYFAADKEGAKATELKEIYGELRTLFPELPSQGSKQAMANALREYEANNPDNCILIKSEDQFYGASKGKNRLAPHIQWVFVSASKDYGEESEETKVSALGQLLSRTIRSKVNFTDKISTLREKIQDDYQEILDTEQAILNDLSKSLSCKLKDWSHPDVDIKVLWTKDSEKSVKVEEPWAAVQLGERGFESNLARFGHGLQRSYMLALLQELVTATDENAPTLIMAIEEPELYQHPPQAKYLANVLYDLSSNIAANSQVMVCSHSPQFILADNFESVRVVRGKGELQETYISRITYSELAEKFHEVGSSGLLRAEGIQAKLYPTLNPTINEMFFCKKLILVEGIEDTAYLTTYLELSKRMEEFRKTGGHIVAVGGKSNLGKPLAMAKLLDIPVYVMFDADTDKEKISDETRRKREVDLQKKDNEIIIKLNNDLSIQSWPDCNIITDNLTIWETNITDIVKDEIGSKWEVFLNKAYSRYGQPGGLQKNPLAISYALEVGWNENYKSNSLLKVVEKIIDL